MKVWAKADVGWKTLKAGEIGLEMECEWYSRDESGNAIYDLPSKASIRSAGKGLKNDFVILSLFLARPIGRVAFLA